MSEPNPEIDAYIRQTTRWKNETKKLREILLDCGLGEEMKWRKPCYTFQGHNVVIIQSFKDHCSLMFFKGSLLNDDHDVLVRPGKNSQAAKRIQFTNTAQVNDLEEVIRTYIGQAIVIENAGLKVDFKEKRELELPDELVAVLDENPVLSTAFYALTPGRQRAYVMHFSNAKQSKTRVARIEKSVSRILDGKGLNDR